MEAIFEVRQYGECWILVAKNNPATEVVRYIHSNRKNEIIPVRIRTAVVVDLSKKPKTSGKAIIMKPEPYENYQIRIEAKNKGKRN